MKVSSLVEKLFFFFYSTSLVGNSCADFALLWYCIDLLTKTNNYQSKHVTSFFYFGQAIGVIVIAQVACLFTDKFQKWKVGAFLDVLYSIVLLFAIFIVKNNSMTIGYMFLIGLTTSALSVLHKNTIAFGVVAEISSSQTMAESTGKLITSINVSVLIGALISGFSYKVFGLAGCMWIAILTFIPMPFIYKKVFLDLSKNKSLPFEMFLSTWKTLFRQKVILVSAVSIALINSATSVLPAIIGVALIKLGAQNSYSTSFIICLGLTITIILNRKISQLTMKFFVNSFIAWSVVPLILVVCFVYFKLNLLSLIVMYATACVGSNIRSIGSGSIRLSAVPRAIFANVNSAYAAVIYIGQILGAFFIVDRLEESFSSTLIITIVLLLLGMFFSMLHLPKVSFKTFLEKKLLSEDSGLNL